jgi:hypothetical protein
MSETEPAAPDPSGEEEAPERQTTPFLVLQFFVFPMSIVAVCVAVFVIFGLIASDQKTPRDYLEEVRTGGGLFNVKRWQAAFSLANALGSEKDLSSKDPAFAPDLVKLFEESKDDDPRVRRYLALSMGRLGDPRVVPALRNVVAEGGPERDAETLIYSIWALGALGDPAAEPDLLRLAESDDAGIRKTALHSVGAFPSAAARAVLVKALEDPVPDVRWNAAVADARPLLPGDGARNHCRPAGGSAGRGRHGGGRLGRGGPAPGHRIPARQGPERQGPRSRPQGPRLRVEAAA